MASLIAVVLTYAFRLIELALWSFDKLVGYFVAASSKFKAEVCLVVLTMIALASQEKRLTQIVILASTACAVFVGSKLSGASTPA